MSRRLDSKQGRAALEIQAAWRLHRLRASLMQRLRQSRWQRDAAFQVRVGSDRKVAHWLLGRLERAQGEWDACGSLLDGVKCVWEE